MNVSDAINLLTKYNKYDEAMEECKRKKILEAPYDLKGHHEIYCRYLSKIQYQFKEELDKTQYQKCLNPTSHNNCDYIYTNSQDYCKKNCQYYLHTIKPLKDTILVLREAQKILKDAVNKDETLQ